ncbi:MULTISPECIES: phosphate ABC transporter substrate-binding protein PstS [Synechocystis]|uniref:Phosphate-binding protein n=1 Tax=Synechocystis salina LEGE 00031 TaxID=1828736 RepID=A0ABR9VPX2_9SYNC|nr:MULTISPECIES: phosphate ABC transporter substrate-binding protein PstS [Synechocystis]MBD2654069.1 phosphate ABC transporter substrate-binding protein PstS [Synechocystis sp. FACHB-383]MBE9240238.1 phosphate ABC transporter substrate-binding protein PstS [Synechocystis salina LEGE 00041]MBE9253396.1 phosphate ABC transporter substrate-binding protein PstS [Synechocystis salina LEGE 00031]
MTTFKQIKKLSKHLVPTASVLALTVGLAACGGGGGGDTAQTSGGESTAADAFANKVSLTGAGASFPAPLYQGWFVALNQAVPNLEVNYQSVGSGAGVEQFMTKTVDFGASDVAMDDEEIAKINGEVIMLPMTAGSIVMAYNLPGVEGLKLSQENLAAIMLGNITTWNDPKLVADNPDVTLPDRPITVVHRSDGSGTTAVFTMNLAAMSPEFKETIGEGKTVEWPTSKGKFIGGKGNEGVTAAIQQNEGAIGYIEYGYASNNNLTMASLQNKDGQFVVPTDANASATLAAVELPENLREFITNPAGAESYPIVTYSWMLLYPQYADAEKAKGIEAMVEFGLNEGQTMAPALGYVPLPQNVREKVAAAADKISPDYTITLK